MGILVGTRPKRKRTLVGNHDTVAVVDDVAPNMTLAARTQITSATAMEAFNAYVHGQGKYYGVNPEMVPVEAKVPTMPEPPKVKMLKWESTKPPPRPKFTPNQRSVAGCCGLGELAGWDRYGNPELDMKSVSAGVYDNYIAILNGTQRATWHDRLLAAGFKVIRNGLFNGVHSSLLTLYLWEKKPHLSPDNPEFDDKKTVIKQVLNGYRYVHARGPKSGYSKDDYNEITIEDYRSE